MTGPPQIYRPAVLKKGMGGCDKCRGGVGQIKTVEGTKEVVKARGQIKHRAHNASDSA